MQFYSCICKEIVKAVKFDAMDDVCLVTQKMVLEPITNKKCLCLN